MKKKTFWYAVALASFVSLFPPASAAPAHAARSSAQFEAAVSTAPVVLGGKEIFLVREKLLSLSADERAQRISARIAAIARNPLDKTENIKVIEGDGSTDILFNDIVIMSVTEKDAARDGTTRMQLAEKNADLIRAAVLKYRRQYNVRTILAGFGIAFLLTVLFVAGVYFLNRGYRALLVFSLDWIQRHNTKLAIQKTVIVPTKKVIELLFGVLKILRFVLVAGICYFYVPALLSLFPWTRGLSVAILGYVIDPLETIASAVIHYIPNIIFILVIVFCVQYFIKFLYIIAHEIKRERISLPNFYADWAEPTFMIVRFLIWAFTLVIVFPYLPGSDSAVFKGVSVFLGILFSLGSSSAISNAVAGVILTYMRPFKIGDRVKISDTVGDVVEKGLLVTRIKTIKNVYVTVPNSLVMGSHMINYSSLSENEGLILNTSVTIGYDVPWPRVHELLISAAAVTENILKAPAPFVLQNRLNDYNVSYEINAYTDQPVAMAQTYSVLHQNIQNAFNAAGIEIMSPSFTAVRDGNTTTVPPESRAHGYRPPPFRVKTETTSE